MGQEGFINIVEGGIYNENWLKEIEKFPELKKLQADLDDLMSIDKRHMTPNEIRQLLFETIVMLPNSSNKIASQAFNSLSLWRVRTHISTGECKELPSCYSYPKICLSNGRANIKGTPVFYCSGNMITSLFESKPMIGDIVYVSKWRATCKRPIVARFLFSESLPEKNPFFTFSRSHFEGIAKMARAWGKEKAAQLELITRFLGNLFVKEEPPYMLASWLANDILFGKAPVDLLFYPSVVSRQVNCNIAINPAFVDEYLYLETIYEIEIEKKDAENVAFGVIRVGEIKDHIISWREPTDKDMSDLGDKKRVN